MTYDANILDDNISQDLFFVFKPRRWVNQTWTNVSGHIFSTTWAYGPITQVLQTPSSGHNSLNKNSYTLTLGTSALGLTEGQWFYDSATGILYVYISPPHGDDDPNHYVIVAEYELYAATKAINWFRVPTDITSTPVHFEGIVSGTPRVKQNSADIIYGVIPVDSTSIELIGVEQTFTKHFYDTSWSRAPVASYHLAGELDASNIKKIFAGVVKGVTYKDNNISLTVLSSADLLSDTYTNLGGSNNINVTDSAGAVTTYAQRDVFGRVDGAKMINTFNSPVAGVGLNKVWFFGDSLSVSADVEYSVAASPASTTTRTYLTSTVGINVDDKVALYKGSIDKVTINPPGVSPTTIYYVKVNLVTSTYIEHTANAALADNTYKCYRPHIGNVFLKRNNLLFDLYPIRDYVAFLGSLTFDEDLVTTLSLGTDLTNVDEVYARIYGYQTLPQIGGVDFGSLDTTQNSITNGVVLIYQILKMAGIQEADIDTATFQTLAATVTDVLGFMVPLKSSDNFPSYRSVLETLCLTMLLKLYINHNNQWTIAQIKPFGSSTIQIASDDILEKTFEYDLDYSELVSEIVLQYWYQEMNFTDASQFDVYQKKVTQSSLAKILHQIVQSKTLTSYHLSTRTDSSAAYFSTYAVTLASHLSFILGERRGKVTMTVRHPFVKTDLSDIVNLTRLRLPGQVYDGSTSFQRQFSLLEIDKNFREIGLSMDDQLGIQESLGSW